MNRPALTLVVTGCMWAVYRLYVQVMAPLTAPPADLPLAHIPTPRTALSAPDFGRSDEHVQTAEWTRDATFKVQHAENAYLYFNRYESRGNRVDVEPFALIWHDPKRPDEDPYVFLCDSARVTFEREFKVGGSSPGRMIAGRLDGQVRITGPDGLRIDGRNCVFSEAEHQLYSDHPLSFAYSPRSGEVSRVEGEADLLQIDLTSVSYPALGKDMPRVAGVESIILRRNVKLDFTYMEEGEVRNARVTSAGPFTYEVEKKLATFQEQVRVARPTNREEEPPALDELHCHWLALQFEETPATEGESAGALAKDGSGAAPADDSGNNSEDEPPLGRLRFRLLRAMGQAGKPVRVSSQKAGFTGTMMDLGYDAVNRVLAMLDAQPEGGVILHYEGATLKSPSLRVAHDAAGEVVSAQCLQAGELLYERAAEGNDPPLQVRALWKKQLWLEPQPHTGETVVYLEGDASMIQPGEQGILCDRLTLWLDSSQTNALALRSRSDPRILAIPGAGVNSGSETTPASPLPLRRVLAEGHVAIAGRLFRAEKVERVDVRFETGRLASPPTESAESPQIAQASHATGEESALGDDQAWLVIARTIDVRVVQDPVTGRVEPAEVVADGKIEVTQLPPETTKESGTELLSVKGNRVHMLNAGAADQTLHLAGDPAHLWRGGVHIEGNDLIFDRASNMAKVVGKGMMQIPVQQSISGEKLDVPTQLDVHWSREMKFDGQAAKFVERVLARLETNALECDEMTVSLNRRIDFTESRPNARGLTLQNVHCKNGVGVQFYSFENDQIVGLTEGRAAAFQLRYDTGDFEVLGAGHFEGWQRGQGRRVEVESDDVARANQPVESEGLEWEYTKVEFAGRITGNIHKRHGTLQDRVRVMYAPVDNVRKIFVRDQLSKDTPSSKKAVWLGCDELEITMHPWEGRERDFVQLLARGERSPVELEGRLFQANADTLSYDESKKLFTLRGLGSNKASLAYQERPGAPYSPTRAQMIQFNPANRSGSVQGSDGAFGAP
jgi:hypothetical protein